MKDMNNENIICGLGISLLIILLIIPFVVLSTKTETLHYQRDIQIIVDVVKEVEKETEEEEVNNEIYCSCVKTAREEGVDIPYNTDAKDFVPNSIPEIGGLVLLKYGLSSHVAVIIDFIKEGIIIIEGNKIHCERTQRIIPYDYYAIKGFWKPNK